MDHLALAPELVAECIKHLHESLPDLISCALVARAWVYPAQVHLFRALTILGKAFSRPPFGMKFLRWPHLRTLMKDSPHLIPHIRRLTTWLSNEDLAILAEMSNFPFTHLEYLHSRHVGSLLRPPVLALQQFISLETLRTLKLDTGRILDPTILVEIWSLFPSPLLKRLKFDIPVTFEPLLSPSLNSDVAPFDLEALRIIAGKIDRRLLWTLYPWKLSSLKALSLLGTEVSWKELAPLIPAIEVLDFGLRPSIIDLDLASFSNLSVLRIRFVPRTTQNIHNQLREIEDLGPMLGLFLSTLRRPSQIRTFVFSCPPLHPMIAKEIDSTLSAHLLDDAATVEIEVSSNVSKIPESFPRLRARNLLRYRELTADSRGINDRSADNAWWENIVTTL